MNSGVLTPAGSRRLLPEVQLGLHLVVEAGWLAAWAVGLGVLLGGREAPPLLPAPVIAGLLVLAVLATRIGRRLRSGERAQILVVVLGLTIAVLVGIGELWVADSPAGAARLWGILRLEDFDQHVLGASAIALLAWWRGIVAARTRITLDAAEAAFRRATVALAVLFVLNLMAGGTLPVGALMAAVLAVVAAGLIAMPLARVLEASGGRRGEEPPLRLGGHWLVILLGAVAGLLLLAAGLASILTFQRLDALLRLMAGPIDALLWIVVYAVALPVGYLAAVIVYLLRLLIQPGGPPPLPPAPPDFSWLDALRSQPAQGGPPELLLLVGRWIVVVVLAVLVARLLGRALFWLAEGRSDDGVEEVRDFVWSWAALWAALRDRVRHFLARVQPPTPTRDVRAAGALAQEHNSASLGPRALYRELLSLGARVGHPRRRAETPHEYERALVATPALSAGSTDVEILTSVYVQARYGPEAPSPPAVAAARAALVRLEEVAARHAQLSVVSQQPAASNHEPPLTADG